jgi:hypothetical protein
MSDAFSLVCLSVERTGIEWPVTLTVQGRLVSGYLTQWANYTRWSKEVLLRATQGSGESIPARAALPSAEIRKSQAEAFLARYPEATDEGARPELGEFAIRNAVVHGDAPMTDRQFPYLVIFMAHVGAFTFGTPSENEPELSFDEELEEG